MGEGRYLSNLQPLLSLANKTHFLPKYLYSVHAHVGSYLSNSCDHYLTRSSFRAERLVRAHGFHSSGEVTAAEVSPNLSGGNALRAAQIQKQKEGSVDAQLTVSFSFVLLSPAYSKVASVFNPHLIHSVHTLQKSSPRDTQSVLPLAVS